MRTRTERDPLGPKKVPADAYYGIHTLRAFENFPISGLRTHPELIRSLGAIKLAAAKANVSLKFLDGKKGAAIATAAKEVMSGGWDKQFVVDPFQAGAGTPLNMNANEVIANRAIEILGGKKGDYRIIHPNDHVNMGQSTNDAIPTAIRVSCLSLIPELLRSCDSLVKSLRKKSREFMKIPKSGRTHLQDAVPILLGQEFSAYAESISKSARRISENKAALSRVNLGGTAIGTGVNTSPKYRQMAVKNLSALTRTRLVSAPNLFEGTSSMTDLLSFSADLRSLAVDLSKLCNDIRLLGSGPMTAISEILLPAVEPGSSIMPGKVNPSMAEMLNMVCDQVLGNDEAISLAAQQGQLELNVMMPVIAHNILQSVKLLTNGMREFDKRCVRGLVANKDACSEYYENSLGLATLLAPKLGYDQAAALAQEALRTKKTIRQIAREKGILSEKELDKLLASKNTTRPNR